MDRLRSEVFPGESSPFWVSHVVHSSRLLSFFLPLSPLVPLLLSAFVGGTLLSLPEVTGYVLGWMLPMIFYNLRTFLAAS